MQSQQRLLSEERAEAANLHLPSLTISGYFDFLGTAMLVLFVVGLVLVFVYEYEALRRSKT